MSRWVPQVEMLETRLTPATRVNATLVTYRDVDGDDVKIILSKPRFTDDTVANNVLTFSTGPGGVNGSNDPQQLQTVDLTGLAAAGLSLTIQAKPSLAGGDGFASVGFINAAGFDLKNVVVDGDLGRILAGNDTVQTPGLKLLRVQSLGVNGTATQEAGGDLKSVVVGRVGKLRVLGNIQDASFRTAISHPLDLVLAPQERPFARINIISIGGSIVGGSTQESGEVFSFGLVQRLFVGGDIQGGGGENSGQISLSTGVKNAIIRGDIVGGAGDFSGQLFTAAIGNLQIGGDIQGGIGNGSGHVFSNNFILNLTVHGSLLGGTGTRTGGVLAFGVLRRALIKGDIVGGSIGGIQETTHTGYLEARRIINMTVRGSVIAGTNASVNELESSGAIRADYDIVQLLVRGNLVGNATQPVLITAMGRIVPTATRDVAIGTLRVGGRVEQSLILAGYAADDPIADDDAQINPDAQIGKVIVGGNWIASTLAAGIEAGADGLFGIGAGADADTLIASPAAKPNGLPLSRIDFLWIKGLAQGTADPGDHFAITAERVKKVQIGNTVVPLTAGAHNDDVPLGSDGDFRIKEL